MSHPSREALARAVRELPFPWSYVIALYYGPEACSILEIAAVLSLSPTAVQRLLTQAEQKMGLYVTVRKDSQ